MPNISAKTPTGNIYFRSTKALTDADPAVSSEDVRDAVQSVGSKLPANLTVTNGRLLVDGSGITQPINGTVAISGTVTTNTGLSQPLTDTELRATPVPISGTVTATGPLTDTQLRAAPVGISGTVNLGTIAGAATETTLGSINNKLPALSSGRLPVDIGGSGSITITSGTITVANEVEIKNDTNSPVPISGTSLTSIDGKLPTSVGIKAKTQSLPVVLATDQPSRPVSMQAITLSNVSGDQTIRTPSAGKALQIFSIVLQNPVTLTRFQLRSGTTPLTGELSAYDFSPQWLAPLGLDVDQPFVINLPTTGTLTGYITWREE